MLKKLIPYKYHPTLQEEDGWGYLMDKIFEPFFDKDADKAFYADVFQAINNHSVNIGDAGICHSISMPNESYIHRYSELSASEILLLEKSLIQKFSKIYTLSTYFASILKEKYGFNNICGRILYPPPHIPSPFKEIIPQVVIAQRFSEEKLPTLLIELANRMPDINFVFVNAFPPPKQYIQWFDLSPNISYRCIPSKVDYYNFIARSGCGLVATTRDNFGVSAIECLAAKRPYVAPDIFAFREIIKDELCLYEPYCLESMEVSLRYALNSKSIYDTPYSVEDSIEDLYAHLMR